MGLLAMVITSVVYLIDSRLGAILLLFAAAYYIFVRKDSIYQKILNVIMYSTPYYTFSIFGDRQRLSLCIVAVLILCVFLTINLIERDFWIGMGTAYKFLLFLIFLVTYFLSLFLGSQAPIEMVFVTYQLIVLGYLICILPDTKDKELSNVNKENLLELFVRGICATAITLYIQYGAYKIFGIYIGQVYEYNSNRIIFNSYFNAKSVLSLYIAIGMLYFFIRYINDNCFRHLIWIAILVGATLINNSRTGLGCFAICVVLYCVFHMKQLVGSIRVIVTLTLVAAAGLYVVQYMLETRSSLAGIADDNGRVEQIVEAFKTLSQYIFSGIGGSEVDYRSSSIGITIHNSMVAYLMQFGVIGGLAVDMLLISPVFSRKSQYWYYLLCILLGGMFFANWQNALFIIPVYILCILEGQQE